jgi:cell division protease FtsH
MENPSRPPNGNGPDPLRTPPRRPPSNTWMMFFLLAGVIMFALWYFRGREPMAQVTPDFFYKQFRKVDEVKVGERIYRHFTDLERAQHDGKLGIEDFRKAKKELLATNIRRVEFHDPQQLYGEFIDEPDNSAAATNEKELKKLPKRFYVVLPKADFESEGLQKELRERGVIVSAQLPQDSSAWMFLIYIAVSVLLFFGVLFFIRRAQSQMMGGGFLGNFSKSPAKRYDSGKTRVTFNDVAGLENVKSDLEEIVAFLKNPERFQRLGGRIPKGTLLVGPPGTGKTLLARAVAGEAGVPFFSINGSEFIQLFVGVGASRVRDLFQTARENSPCILFIDEIDAVGRVRGAGLGGGHDEREQTLNQILSEMDGFTPDEAVIVVAATNRPDVLDPALLRPGRFDRHITVDKPSLKARADLFKVHCREVKVADNIDFNKLARGTVGLTGADIRNMVNEAALYATRLGKEQVEMSDFDQARDKVLMGPKRDEVMNAQEKRMTAYHECGHAVVAWLVPSREHVHKITVIPRGRALGVTQLMGEEDRLSIGQRELHGMLMFMLGGRAAEKLVFDEYRAGAENDLQRATAIARRMVTAWGMSERLGPVSYKTAEDHPFLGREIHEQRQFSEHTQQLIDEEVARILHQAAEDACRLLERNRDKLDILATALEQREELDENEIASLIGPSANARTKETDGLGPQLGWKQNFPSGSPPGKNAFQSDGDAGE